MQPCKRTVTKCGLLDTAMERVADHMESIAKSLEAMNSKMDGLDHIIRGNGSPGLVQKVGEQKIRIDSIEDGRNRWRDAFFTVAGGIAVGVVVFLFSNLWSARHGDMPSVQAVGGTAAGPSNRP